LFTLTNTIKRSISEAVISWCVESHIKVPPVYMMVLLGMNSYLLYALWWNRFLPLFCVLFLVLSNLMLAMDIVLGMAYIIKDFRKHQ